MAGDTGMGVGGTQLRGVWIPPDDMGALSMGDQRIPGLFGLEETSKNI